MKLKIVADKNLNDGQSHVFYGEDFTPNDINNQYKIMKSIISAPIADTDDYDEETLATLGANRDKFIKNVGGDLCLVLPRGEILTIEKINKYTVDFDIDGAKFDVPRDTSVPMHLRLLSGGYVNQ